MNFEKEIEEIREWLLVENEKKVFSGRAVIRLTQLLDGELSPENISRLASRLSTVAVLWKNMLLDGLIKNESSCLNYGSWFLDSEFICQKILILTNDHPKGQASLSSKDLLLTFLLLLSFNRWEQAEWLGRCIFEGDAIERFNGPQATYELREVSEWEALGGDVKGFGAVVASLRRFIPGRREKEGGAGQIDKEPAFPYWEEKPLCGLVLRLWLIMAGKAGPYNLPEGLPSCGAYAGLFEHWDDEDKLSDSILQACDYHLSRTEENPKIDYDIAEFEIRPYNVLPVEILALSSVRRHFSLSTPWPKHPLLSSVFIRNLPKELPSSDNELILQSYKAAHRIFPQIESRLREKNGILV